MLTVLALLAAHAADVDPFRPSGSLASGTGTLQGESPFVLGDGFGGGVHVSFAQDLALEEQADGTSTALVANVLPVELYGAWTNEDLGLRVEAFAPVYAHVGAPGSAFSGPAMGDLRAQANLVLAEVGPALHTSLIARVELPTGTRAASTRSGIGIGLLGVAGGELPEDFGWVANIGFGLASADDLFGVGSGSTIDLLAGGFWTAPSGMRLGAEIDAQVGLVKRSLGRNTTSAVHVFAQNRLTSGLGLTVGAGTGLLDGVGSPRYRVTTALTWQPTIRDTDADGLLDDVDLCVNEPEDADGFEDTDGCPELDNDLDGIPDESDVCPLEPEDADGFEDADGCPDADNDGDGVLDGADRCPAVAGLAELGGCPDRDADGLTDADDVCPDDAGPLEMDGCPDRDADRVPDLRDACPDDPIPPDADPATSDGCPKLAYLTEGRITIYEKVNFETGRAQVAESSFGLLREVADILQATPAVKRLEVGGHTDNVGSDRFNLRLSQQRADAVREYLVQAGVAAERLTARGYGETTPITTNRTDTGKARNRRVEFVVLEQELTVEELPPLRPPVGLDTLWDSPPGSTPAPPTPVQPPPSAPVAPIWDTPPGGAAPVAEPAVEQPVPEPVVQPPVEQPAPEPAPEVEPIEEPEPTPEPERPPVPAPSPWDSPAVPAAVAEDPSTPATEPPVLEPPASTPVEPPPVVEPPAPVLPTSAVYTDPDAPPVTGGLDPTGRPGRLSVELYGDLTRATVYLDNEPLPRTAPLREFPVMAGEHSVWVQDDASGLDHDERVVFHNGEHVRLVFPLGAEPTGPAPETLAPRPAPTSGKRGGRRSRKR